MILNQNYGITLPNPTSAQAEDIASGKTAYNSDGELMTGIAQGGGSNILTGQIALQTRVVGANTFYYFEIPVSEVPAEIILVLDGLVGTNYNAGYCGGYAIIRGTSLKLFYAQYPNGGHVSQPAYVSYKNVSGGIEVSVQRWNGTIYLAAGAPYTYYCKLS